VDDPEGYSLGLQSDLRATDAKVDRWLYGGVDQFPTDPDLSDALLTIADVPDSRQALLLLAEILRAPGLAERLSEVLRPARVPSNTHPPPTNSLRN
jgi:hypothetical protein